MGWIYLEIIFQKL